MNKKLVAFFTGFLFFTYVSAQIPNGYYNAAASKTGENLRAALRDIVISGSVKLPYTSSAFDVWDAYSVTDTRPGNNTLIWDMYSDIPGGTPVYNFTIYTNQCGTSGAEGDCYSREHQIPNSWWGGLDDANNPQYTDLHHLPPADQYVNNKKSAHPIGQISSPTWTSTNGSKVGPCSWPGYTGVVFEPINEYKGDFARAYLYMATRYMNNLSSWVVNYPSTEAQYIINSTGNNYKQWFIDMLVQWCINDPVSQKEIDRNNAIYYNTPQHNRNPYIDHPEYVCIVWSSNRCSSAPYISSITQNPLFPNSTNTVSVTASVTSTAALTSVKLVWGLDGINYSDTIPMSLSTGSTFITNTSIPAASAGTIIYYKIIAIDNLANTSISSGNNYSVLKEEPSNYPGSFACGTITTSSISLTWLDATGTSLPDGYLVKVSSTSLASISDPIDGIPEANGSFTKNISWGIQATSFSGLSSSTPYYFKIYSYSNSGSNINYKNSAPPPSISCTTAISTGGGCATDLIISEYVEGSSSNKYIELYNNTGASINLADYKLRLFANGVSTPTNDVALTGTLNNLSTIVYKNSSATVYLGAATANSAINYNGNDAVALYKVSTASYVDIFGRIGEDPGLAWTSGSFTTMDKTLVRNASVTAGVTTNPSAGFPTLSTQWTQYNQDVVSNLGSHTMTCISCSSPTASASNISFTAVSQNAMTINWTNGNGSNRIVVVKEGSAVTGNPLNGSGYNANNIFGSGNILNAGEYVVYNNTGSSVSITNLTGAATYYISIFEYNCAAGSQIYLIPGVSSSRQTYSIVTGTVPESQYCVNAATGYSTTIDFVSTGTFSNNTYTVQLSDATGSFASPVSIGSMVSNLNSETINCIIPANTPSGTSYLMRVISNGPVITGSFSNAFEIILSSTAQTPSSVSSNRSGFCSSDTGTISLSSLGGSGTTLSWFSASCGGSFVGSGNPLVIPSPAVTTTYYARWGTSCSNSNCASVTVTVSALPAASAGSAINSCSGSGSITMTGASATGSANSWSGGIGLGTWTQNANPALATFLPAVSAGSFVATLTVTGTGSCPEASVTSSRIISWGTSGTWTGAVSTDWFTAGNWCGGIPVATTNIIIPPSVQLLFSPTIGSSGATCLNITIAGSVSIANGYNLDVNGNWTNNGAILNGNTGTVSFKGVSKTIGGTTSTFFPGIVIVPGATITMSNNNSCSSLTFTSGSACSLTLSGNTFTVNNNVLINNPQSNTNISWNINNGNAIVTGNVTIGSGTSQSNRIAKISVSTGSLTIGGNLVYSVGHAAAGILELTGIGATLNIAGNINLNTVGTLNPGTSSTVNYNGSLAGQTITTGSGITYNNLALNNTNISGVSLASSITTSIVTGHVTVQSGTFNNGGFSIIGNSAKQFSVWNAATYKLTGNTLMPTGFGSISLLATSTVDFAGSLSQTIGAINYGHLTTSGTGARILTSSGTIGVAGIFTPGTNSFTVTGSTINFNGTNQSVPVFNVPTGYNNLSISQNTGMASLVGNITVNGTLNLVSGNLNLGINNLTLSGTATVSGSPFSAAKMVIADGAGELRKIFTANTSFLFPVGDNTVTAEYSPVTVNYTSGSYAAGAYTGIKLTNTKHPSNTNSVDFLNRYWTISNSGISNPIYNINAVYVSEDINGSDMGISMAKYTGGIPWIKYSAANPGSKLLTATAVTNTGNITVSGISSSGPNINITGGDVTICSGNSLQLNTVVSGSTSYTYIWTPATGLSAANIANPVATPNSTTTYTLTVTDGNGFSSNTNTTITVSGYPVASITASGPVVFCQGGSVTLSSAEGTSYSWNTGTNTRDVLISASGNYSVTVTNSAGCSSTSAATLVTVNPLPTVSFSGLAASYCFNAGIAALTGSPTGGSFTGPGIQGNAFDPSSAGAGTHFISYTYTNGNGCTNSSTQSVTVYALPTVSFTGLTTNYCSTDATVTLTGSPTGGMFTGAGISGNNFDPSQAGAGTHFITYSYSNGNGCTNSSTQSVTVNVCNTTITINLKLYLQGYYIDGGIMQPVLNNQAVPFSLPNETDSITVEVHDHTTFALVDSKLAVLLTDGTVSATFSQPSGSYYVAIKHRNTLQTWSANPVQCLQSSPLYDFTSTANMAMGDNQVEVQPGIWAFYTGDINQDEFIDGNDFPEFDTENFTGVNSVYVSTDMNGDGFVDGNDFPIFDNNSFWGFQSIHP